MVRQTDRNKGFTLIELLISMALLSIIMVMVVQFMSSTAGANRKAQYNIRAQSVAEEVMRNMEDNLMQAEYVKVIPKETTCYSIKKNGTESGNRTKEVTTTVTPPVELPTDCQLEPDNYGNYVKESTKPERKVIVDMATYQLPGEKNNTVYPLNDDLETGVTAARSFRILKQEISGTDTYMYIKPEYIYMEYTTTAGNLCNVIYKIDETDHKIYMWRSSEDTSLGKDTPDRFSTAKSKVDGLTGNKGLMTENMTDFYLSADVEGNALLFDSLFDVSGYKFNSTNTVKFRNSQVLTVRPQNLYLKVNSSSGGTGGTGGGTGGTGGTGGGTGGTGGTGDGDEGTGGSVVPPPTGPTE